MKTAPLALIFALLCAPVLSRADAEKADYNNDVQVEKLLRSSTNSIGQTIEYPTKNPAEVSMLMVTLPVGKNTGWHQHPVPLVSYVLQGEITVEIADGTKHTFHEGEAFAECVNTLHEGTNTGSVPTKLVICVIGEKNTPFTIKQEAAPSPPGAGHNK